MTKKIAVIITLVFIAKISFGQIAISNDDDFLRDIAHYQVKDLSQFFERFNYQEQLTFKNDSTPNRFKNLIGLLNLKDTSLRTNPKTITFIKYICDDRNKIKISFKDDKWYAVAHCTFSYHNANKDLIIVLKPERTNNDRYYWVIYDIQSDLFTLPRDSKQNLLFINPMNHEVGFSELSKALSKKRDIIAYTPSTYSYDPLSAFLQYIKNGDLEFKQINSIDFDFLQVDGWFFTVKDFFRVNYNSGWLIASIKKMNSQEKNTFIRNHFIE